MRVFLGHEWTRHQSARVATFTSGGRGCTVTAIHFEGLDSFSYRLKDDPRPYRLDFSPVPAR